MSHWEWDVGLYLHPNSLGTPSSGSSLHLFLLSSSLFPSESSLAIQHMHLAVESLFSECDIWEKADHCSEVL